MSDMILYLSMDLIGYVFGSKLRNVREKLKWIGTVQTIAIFCLVVCMGTRMGSNEEIIKNMGTIGVTAIVFTLVIALFNIIAVHFAAKVLRMDKRGNVLSKEEKSLKSSTDNVEKKYEEVEGEAKTGINKMTIIIVIAVIVGILLGYFVIRRIFEGRFEEFDNLASMGIKIGLCILIFFTGIDMGLDGTIVSSLKAVGLKILIVPVFALVASLIGGYICGLFFSLSPKESLAIAGGLGWYSLAPGLIMDAGFISASAISFFHNVTREIFSIIIIPIVAEE